MLRLYPNDAIGNLQFCYELVATEFTEIRIWCSLVTTRQVGCASSTLRSAHYTCPGGRCQGSPRSVAEWERESTFINLSGFDAERQMVLGRGENTGGVF